MDDTAPVNPRPDVRPARVSRRVSVALGVVLSMLAVEGIARYRFAHPNPPPAGTGPAPRGMYVDDAAAGFRFAPGFQVPGLDFRTDEHGLRDSGRAWEPATEGTLRVVVLGDSFAAGWGIDDEGSFAALLDRTLTRAAGREVEVWNLGVTHYGPEQSLERLRSAWSELRPDVVVLAFCLGNDAWDVVGGPGYFRISDSEMVSAGWAPRGSPLDDARAEMNRFEGAPDLPLDGWLQRHSYGWRMLLQLVSAARGVERRTPFGLGRFDYEVFGGIPALAVEPEPDGVDEAWGLVDGVLAQLRGTAMSGGARLIVVPVPTRLQVHAGERGRAEASLAELIAEGGLAPSSRLVPDRGGERLAAICERLDIELVDVATPLRAAADSERLYFRFDSHWTAGGHRVAAEALGPALVDGVDVEVLRAALREEVAPGSYPTEAPPGRLSGSRAPARPEPADPGSRGRMR